MDGQESQRQERRDTEGRSRRYSDRDIELLQHIQELTNEGVGLAGVKRILELEAALEDAAAEIESLRARMRKARRDIAEAEERVHRQYRRDLVPVSKAIVHVRRR